jgi:Ni,Fe-hydrogenase maturation factor
MLRMQPPVEKLSGTAEDAYAYWTSTSVHNKRMRRRLASCASRTNIFMQASYCFLPYVDAHPHVPKLQQQVYSARAQFRLACFLHEP